MQLYKMEEWQEASGYYRCACTSDLAHNSGHWLHPARILGMEASAYVKWVIDNFNPRVWHNEECSMFLFSWEKQSDMRKFKNFINKAAREKRYMI